MRKLWIPAGAVLVAMLAGLGVARAWWVNGHETITEAATMGLPDEIPAFFRAGGKALANFAGDPDRWKNREARFLKVAEGPNHFLDMEDLEGNALPPDRFQAVALLTKLKHDPDKTGFLPYAIVEGFDRLAVAFYDFRHEPANPAVPMKCLVYAGNLAHYTTDAAMPLHTTRNYDGKPGPGGQMIQRGIHAKLDGFPEKFGFKPEEIARGFQAKKIEDVWDYVLKFINESHTHVDKSYELDAAGAFDNPTDASRAFVMARCRAGAQFTMDIWYTAWLKSATLPPPF